jgi:hypothetical protein
MPLTPQQAAVLDHFKHRPVATLEQLRSALDISHMTVFRALKQHGYFTSFNHNARYYTLRQTPRFDANGLWFYRSIGFSRHRTLPDTLLAVVNASPAGYTPSDLALLLRTPVNNLLATLARRQRLARRGSGRSVVYLALHPQRQQEQWLQRCNGGDPSPTRPVLPANLSPATILPLLAELMRSPEDSIDQLARTLRRQSLPVDPPDVQAVFAFYQLEKKEALCRSPKYFRMCSLSARANCVNSEHSQRKPFTPSTGWPRKPRPARCCRR